MVAAHAEVLQLGVAVRAQHEVGLDGIAARGALAVLHELALLERDLQLLLVFVQLQQGRAQQAVGDNAEHGHQGHYGPDVPGGAAQVGIAHDPHDREHVQDDQQHQHDGEGRLHFRRPQLRQKLAH